MLNFSNPKPFFMKKIFFTAIFLTIVVYQASAQKSKDVLYLKNGSMIFGKLIEIYEDMYKIQTSDGSIFVYSSSDVEKFMKEAPVFDGRKQSGFSFSIEAGILAGAQNSQFEAPFSFNVLGGITSNTLNITSVGSGVEFFGRPYTPLYIEYKRIVNKSRTSPYVFVRAGGVVPLGGDESGSSVVNPYDNGPKDYKGGGSITLGTGISWVREDYETYLSFAYRHANTSYKQQEYGRGLVTYTNTLNRLEIKFGFKF